MKEKARSWKKLATFWPSPGFVDEKMSIFLATGLIAGEALAGLVKAFYDFQDKELPLLFQNPSYLAGVGVIALIAFVLLRVPIGAAGDPNEPAPPVAMM